MLVIVITNIYIIYILYIYIYAAAKSLQSCPTLCDPMDCRTVPNPGPDHGGHLSK